MNFADELNNLARKATPEQENINAHRMKLVNSMLEEFHQMCKIVAAQGKHSYSFSPSARGAYEGAYSLEPYSDRVVIKPDMYDDWKEICKKMQMQLAAEGFKKVEVTLVPQHDVKVVRKMFAPGLKHVKKHKILYYFIEIKANW